MEGTACLLVQPVAKLTDFQIRSEVLLYSITLLADTITTFDLFLTSLEAHLRLHLTGQSVGQIKIRYLQGADSVILPCK